eukprot:3768180-Rhodomonas_salina.1
MLDNAWYLPLPADPLPTSSPLSSYALPTSSPLSSYVFPTPCPPSCYALPTPCPVPAALCTMRPALLRRAWVSCYAMCSTVLGYAARRCAVLRAGRWYQARGRGARAVPQGPQTPLCRYCHATRLSS